MRCSPKIILCRSLQKLLFGFFLLSLANPLGLTAEPLSVPITEVFQASVSPDQAAENSEARPESSDHHPVSALDWLMQASSASPLSPPDPETDDEEKVKIHDYRTGVIETDHERILFVQVSFSLSAKSTSQMTETGNEIRSLALLIKTQKAISATNVNLNRLSAFRTSKLTEADEALLENLSITKQKIEELAAAGKSSEEIKSHFEQTIRSTKNTEKEAYLFEFKEYRELKRMDPKLADLLVDATAEKISHYIWQKFRYESDQAQFGKEDRWQSLEELLLNRKGDCEDFAYFAHMLLQLNGKESFMLNVYSNKMAHTVTVLKENGEYKIIDGKKVRKIKADNLWDLLAKIYPDWKTGALVDFLPELQRARILKNITRL